MWVWVFNAEGRGLPSGVFSTRERAEEWISQNALSGILTAYPVDTGAIDWAIREGHFKPKGELSPASIASFSSAFQEHYHYDGGVNRGAT